MELLTFLAGAGAGALIGSIVLAYVLGRYVEPARELAPTRDAPPSDVLRQLEGRDPELARHIVEQQLGPSWWFTRVADTRQTAQNALEGPQLVQRAANDPRKPRRACAICEGLRRGAKRVVRATLGG